MQHEPTPSRAPLILGRAWIAMPAIPRCLQLERYSCEHRRFQKSRNSWDFELRLFESASLSLLAIDAVSLQHHWLGPRGVYLMSLLMELAMVSSTLEAAISRCLSYLKLISNPFGTLQNSFPLEIFLWS